MSSISTSALMDAVHRAINATQHIEDSLTSRSGVYRMRQHFVQAHDVAPNADPIPLLRSARNEANFMYPHMIERAKENADCPELNAYGIFCGVLNSIPACSVK
ncbi:MAG: hypothetical protein RBR86_02225 [Pseudobdellovibrionaceae bacterium]|nr:hypothetical protein [Pseudobdellovibrionaceae bacterium]